MKSVKVDPLAGVQKSNHPCHRILECVNGTSTVLDDV